MTSAIVQSALTRSASRTRLSGCSVMKMPIDSFSIASSSVRSNSCVGIGGCAGAADGVRVAAAPASNEVEDRALAHLRVLLGALAGGLRGVQHLEHARGASRPWSRTRRT